eukprot:7381880-Ditylum_brightwellii.AAC.1
MGGNERDIQDWHIGVDNININFNNRDLVINNTICPTCFNYFAPLDDDGCYHHTRNLRISCSDKTPNPNGPAVRIPNGTTMKVTHKGYLAIPDVSKEAKHINIYPDNKSGMLISIVQLCDDRCHVIFKKDQCSIEKDNKAVLVGPRNLKMVYGI